LTRPKPLARSGLAQAVLDLARALRRAGVGVGLRSLLDGLQAAALVGPGTAEDLRWALKPNLTAAPAEGAIFDRFFDHIFLGRPREPDQPRVAAAAAPRPAADLALALLAPARPGESGFDGRPYSPEEVLARRDLAELSRPQLDQAAELLTRRLGELLRRSTPRMRPRPRPRLDFRRTIRRSLSLGGELLRLARRGRRIKDRRLVLVLDVSGSMTAHTRFFLHLARSWLAGRPGRVEVLAFSTRLRRLTRLLADRPWPEALAEIGRLMPEWAGGTRIGQALGELLDGLGRGLVGPASLAVIISDGWDRGDLDLLDRQMARLKDRAWRVAWLNPLLGQPGYEPLAGGMRTALAHLDQFLPAHSLADLMAANSVLAKEMTS
jgi:uncharacterized protein with von Willebrand factor type A (vWA) domain